MQNGCTNIYQNARKIAGLTQERAAELLGLSVRSLADYESGLRLPPNDIADRMVTVYNSQLLCGTAPAQLHPDCPGPAAGHPTDGSPGGRAPADRRRIFLRR